MGNRVQRVNTRVAAEQIGITYDQLRHLVRQGHVTPETNAAGHWEWTPKLIEKARGISERHTVNERHSFR